MKRTGKINPITKQEVMQIEQGDIDFWSKDWEQLTLEEKANYCSFRAIQFLSKDNVDYVSALYYSDSHKYR